MWKTSENRVTLFFIQNFPASDTRLIRHLFNRQNLDLVWFFELIHSLRLVLTTITKHIYKQRRKTNPSISSPFDVKDSHE